MKKCPKCGLASDDGAASCDCGYSFDTRRMEAPVSREPAQRGWIPVNIWAAVLGFFAFVFGAPALFVQYMWASLVAMAVAYSLSDLISRQARNSAFGQRSPGTTQIGLIVVYTAVVGILLLGSFVLIPR